MKKKLIRYSVTLGVGLAIALIVSFAKSLYWQDTAADVMRALSDCFVVPGMLLLLFGLLVVCSNGGTFDMLGYGTRKVLLLFRRKQDEKDKETFYDYRKRKQESKRSFAYLLICGGVYIFIGLIFLILYYNV